MVIGPVDPEIKSANLCYLATPYSKFPGGITAAFEAACAIAGELLKQGVKVYSPIAHTHPIATYAEIDPLDHNIWLPFDEAMMVAADVIVVARLPGWEESRGVAHEIEFFYLAGKQRFDLLCDYEASK